MPKTRFLAILAVVAMTGIVAPTAASADATSTLSKAAQDLTHPGATTVGHGDTLNWVVSYDGAVRGPATVTDPVAATQTYTPGTLRVPPGWTPQWSTDGTAFTSVEPAGGVTAVRAVNSEAHPGGTNLTRQLLPPVQATATATGGDGFTPILYRTPTGGVEAWNTYHHLGQTNPKVVCSDLLTGTPCTGAPWPRPLNTAVGPLGTGNTGDIASTLTPQYVFDPADSSRVYYPGVTATDLGVGCLDLDAQADCGFWPLESVASGNNSLGGLVVTGGNLYGVDTNGKILCLSVATHTPCSGQPYAAVVRASINSNGCGYSCLYYGSMAVAAGKVFVSSSQSGVGIPQLGCFDPATDGACAGWTTAKNLNSTNGSFTYSAFVSYTTGGAARGACSTTVSPKVTTCFALDGSALAAPSVATGVPAAAYSFSPETITGPDGHLRSYFGHWNAGLSGGTTCWDWTANAACAGFPALATHPTAHGGDTRDYGYDYDTTTQCLLGLGDAGYLFSMDPTTGATPCVHSGASVSLDTAGFYCDGATNHVHGYTDARLENIDLSDVDLAHSSVVVTDVNGTPLSTGTFAPDGTVDLSTIDIAAHPHIVVTDQLVLTSTADFTASNHPDLVASFQGDPPQICFHTTPVATCTVTGVANTANGSDGAGALTSNTVSLPVDPGSACSPHLTVNKEICASHCGPTGSGPWVKNSPAGLLGLLGTAYWRISVTNTGTVGAVGATVTDAVTPSCVSAAGTFTVAAGATVRFYCSSTLLLLPLTNTASVTYRGALDPPGTPAVTSEPSSAQACPLICQILGG